jgi:hypothetical protein
MVLRIHNLPSGRRKCNFGFVDEAIMKVVRKPRKLIFFLLGVSKCVFGEVDKAMFQVDENT